MSTFEQFGAEVTIKVGEISDLCKHYGFTVVPSLVLRHVDGNGYSLLISNDPTEELVRCVRELAAAGIESEQSLSEAEKKLFAHSRRRFERGSLPVEAVSTSPKQRPALLKDMTESQLSEHLARQLRFIRSCQTSDTVGSMLVIFSDYGISQYGATVDPETAPQALRELADRIEKRQTVKRGG